MRTEAPKSPCQPAGKIITDFGGLTAVSKIVNVTPNQVQKWRMPREKGGTGGLIPSRHMVTLVEHARQTGMEVSLDTFLPPRTDEADAA